MGTDSFGSTVIIDLGLQRGEPESYDNPRRRTMPSWFGPALVAVLLLVGAAASAAPPRPPLSPVLRVPVGPADPYALTEPGRLLVQTFGMLSQYDLDSGAQRWQAGQATPVFRLRTGGDLLLLRPWAGGSADPDTTAVSLSTGVEQWRRRGNVVAFPGAPVFLGVSGVRSISGTGRRVEREVEGIDPRTGTTRWRVPVPSAAVLIGVPGAGDAGTRMLLVHDDRTAVLHDMRTGSPLASRELPVANYEPENPAVAGGLVLLRHPGQFGMEVSAYDPQTLRPLWTKGADGTFEVRACGKLACLLGTDGVRAIDPATGDERWRQSAWRAVEQHGPHLIAYETADDDDPTALVDAEDGRTLVSLQGWRLVPNTAGEERVVVTRVLAPGGRTMVAIADPAVARLRPLGEMPLAAVDCQAAVQRLVCRSDSGELVVWAYRAPDGPPLVGSSRQRAQ